MDVNCTKPGYTAEWLDLRSPLSNQCLVPKFAFDVVTSVFIAIDGLLLLLVCFALINLFRVPNRRYRLIVVFAALAIMLSFYLAVLATFGERTNSLFVLFGLGTTALLINIILYTNLVIQSVPPSLERFQSASAKLSVVSKDAVVRINFAVGVASPLMMFISCSIMIPLSSSVEQQLVWWGVTTMSSAVEITCCAIICARYTTILIALIEEQVTAVKGMMSGDASIKELLELARKFRIARSFLLVIVVPEIVLSILHGFIIGYQWYWVFIDMWVVAMYCMILLSIYKNVIMGKNSFGKGKNKEASAPTGLTTSVRVQASTQM